MPILDLALKLDKELRAAMQLVREAGAAVLKVATEAGGRDSSTKADETPVTRADLESDRIIREGLGRQFPDDGIVSEEVAGLSASASGRYWVVDPLDGTKAFIAKGQDYAVQLGLLGADGAPILGCVYEPATQRLYHAISGVGASLNVGGTGSTVRQLKVSQRSARSELLLLTSSSMSEADHLRLLNAVGCKNGGRARSVGYKMGRVVRREADVYYSGHAVSVWDTCAPLVILEASGGVVTGMDGAPLKFDVAHGQRVHRGPFVASNAQDHAALVASIAGAITDHDC